MMRSERSSSSRLALAAALSFPALVADFGIASGEELEVGVCGDPATLISTIQGTGGPPALPFNTEVVIEAVVIGDYQGSDGLGGFYVQEEDADADGDPATSEGIFLYDGNKKFDVNVGDLVRLRGEVAEFNFQAQLDTLTNPIICGTNMSVTPTVLPFPINSEDTLEVLEGMIVMFEQPMFVTDNFTLARYGELTLSPWEQLYQPTQLAEPGEAASAINDANDANRILLDDGSLVQDPEFPPYLDADGTRRVGDSVENLTAVLGYGRSGKWQNAPVSFRLHPVGSPDAITFKNTNPRTMPPTVEGAIKIASFNVLNYFTTLDTGKAICGPNSNLQRCRGADSMSEFNRQSAKIISALIAVDADVVGLIEIENNGDSAVRALVHRLNTALGSTVYDFVAIDVIGEDAVRVALIYKPATVTPLGSPKILDDSVDTRFIASKNRPSLAQTFRFETRGKTEELTVVVSHFKSKGSDCDDVGDPNRNDGQGNCAGVRIGAAAALVNWLLTDPTFSRDPDFLVIGDLNAYAQEAPITEFLKKGYIDLLFRDLGDGQEYRYSSYIYRGESGTLDHALATEELAVKITRATVWSNSADEPRFLDYNEEHKSDALIASLSVDAFRASDHDPVIVGLDYIDDPDGDGVIGPNDQCPMSNTTVSVVFEGCNSGVHNRMMANGCSLTDNILAEVDGAKNYGQFVSRVVKFLNDLVVAGDFSADEKGVLMSCLTKSDPGA